MTTIRGLKRLEDTVRRTGGSGDNFHMTWTRNGNKFASLNDGNGWPEIEGISGSRYNTRLLEVAGDAEQPSFRDMAGFPDLQVYHGTPNINRYYGFGHIALDDYVYLFMSTPNHRFLYQIGKPWPGARFFGAKLIYSPDLGKTWKNQNGSPVVWEPWEDRNKGNMVFFDEPDESFSLLTVLQMGKNYEHNRDGYVYVYAPNGNVEGKMNQLVMFRVRREEVLNRAAYQYFVSRNRDGTANWSSNIHERGIVHTFPSGWVNTDIHPYSWHPSVVYNAGLGVYMMANWGMGCTPEGLWFGKPSYLGFWTAVHPWGPWTQIHEEEAWMPAEDPNARAYQSQISPKWIAEDGKSFWMVWTDFQNTGSGRPYYCFNWQKVEVLV